MGYLLVDDQLSVALLVASAVWNSLLFCLLLSFTVYFGCNIRLPSICGKHSSSASTHSKTRSRTRHPSKSNADVDTQPRIASESTVNIHVTSRRATITADESQTSTNSEKKLIDVDGNMMICLVIVLLCNYWEIISDGWMHSNLIFDTSILDVSDGYCSVKIAISAGVWLLHKTMMYFVFSYRVENGFKGTAVGFPNYYYIAFRAICSVLAFGTFTVTAVELFPNYKTGVTADGTALCCIGSQNITGFSVTIVFMAIFQICDFVFSFGSLYVYVARLKKVVRMASVTSHYNEIAHSFGAVMQKSAVLVTVAVVSTSCLILVSAVEMNLYILSSPFDITINTICVLLLFHLPWFITFYDNCCGRMCHNCYRLSDNRTSTVAAAETIIELGVVPRQ